MIEIDSLTNSSSGTLSRSITPAVRKSEIVLGAVQRRQRHRPPSADALRCSSM
jgi:hypothetical protein